MIEMKHDNYIVEKICRLDVRYYLIKVHNRYYVIDYSNPRNFRNYLLYFYPKELQEWKIYDVTDHYLEYISTSFWRKVVSYSGRLLAILIVFYFFSGLVVPRKFKMQTWSYDSRILQNWMYILLSILVGFILVVLLMILNSSARIDLEKYPNFFMRVATINRKKELPFVLKIIYWLLGVVFLVGGSILLGILGQNYIGLFLFCFGVPYYCILSKFIQFQVGTGTSKYNISCKSI
ncbi:hypothetical protein [Streptococcus intermedius]